MYVWNIGISFRIIVVFVPMPALPLPTYCVSAQLLFICVPVFLFHLIRFILEYFYFPYLPGRYLLWAPLFCRYLTPPQLLHLLFPLWTFTFSAPSLTRALIVSLLAGMDRFPLLVRVLVLLFIVRIGVFCRHVFPWLHQMLLGWKLWDLPLSLYWHHSFPLNA